MQIKCSDQRPVVAIAGASGFVGQALMKRLMNNYRVIGLTRNEKKVSESERSRCLNLEWRQADLFSLLEAEKGLQGVDYAFYLVRTGVPSARLTQGKIQDMDVILADNFARAAKKAGVKQIIYLGGLIPEQANGVPGCLQSRLEVEAALRAHGVPVTVLRAGIVIGAGGSCFRMILRLIRHLPMMICPRWMSSEVHPIALQDIVVLLAACIGREETYSQSIDVGGSDTLTYKQMILQIAELMGKKRRLYSVQFLAPVVSSLWLTAVTGIPLQQVKSFVGSMKYPLIGKRRWLQQRLGLPGLPFAEAACLALQEEARGKTEKRKQAALFGGKHRKKKRLNNVRSVQRFVLPRGRNADWAGREYAEWLPRHLKPMIRVYQKKDGRLWFLLAGVKKPLLELTYSKERSTPDRTLYYITGGILARVDTQRRGRMEFRQVLDGRYVIVAIHEFIPRMPWFLYRATQALVHLWVMRSYGRYLHLQAERIGG
ncbi:hypothetical protein ACH33_14565 [Aneurinibacillus sp. XH2]|uniref:NAD-dependent epimerase/dehydratase family protein n=1 Tax=Aneurinibacillus sp. XH2 TaxID=1450761 RepID=UPI00070BB286|nr:NAD(P)H-binding protein [Aneurinibacillus sp. XH2]AMA73940.1 hypothetical protein ACH33_14565 [Aneurinibacillus sp. XH2]